jgi:hypothetical protein
MPENDMIQPVNGNVPALPPEPVTPPAPAPEPPPEPSPMQQAVEQLPSQYPEALTGRLINELV